MGLFYFYPDYEAVLAIRFYLSLYLYSESKKLSSLHLFVSQIDLNFSYYFLKMHFMVIYICKLVGCFFIYVLFISCLRTNYKSLHDFWLMVTSSIVNCGHDSKWFPNMYDQRYHYCNIKLKIISMVKIICNLVQGLLYPLRIVFNNNYRANSGLYVSKFCGEFVFKHHTWRAFIA